MSGQVVVSGRLGTQFLQRIKVLLPEAIDRAIYAAKAELEPHLRDTARVRRKTGQLQDNVAWFISPGQITFRWSALSPEGFDYAKVQDEGVPGRFSGSHFSTWFKEKAKELLMKHLLKELGAMRP